MTLFNRVVQVRVGQPGASEVIIEDLRVTFNISKNADKSPNSATINIYNLSKETRDLIDAENSIVSLFAGYSQSAGPLLVYSGDVTRTTHKIQRPEVMSVIESEDGVEELRKAKFSKSYGKGTSLRTIFNDAIATIKLGIQSQLTDLPDINLANGFSFDGLSKDVLTKILDAAGFEWSVQNNEIKVIQKNSTDSSQEVLVSPETGLIDNPEKLDDSIRQSKGLAAEKANGWSVKSLLRPELEPGGAVAIQSNEIPIATRFRLERVNHIGDNFGESWETTFEALEV